MAEIHAACVRMQCAAVLIEEKLQGPGLGVLDVFRVASQSGAKTAPEVRAIAYVDVNPDHSHPDMKFAETVAVNRGANVRVFRTLPEAEAWIRAEVGAGEA